MIRPKWHFMIICCLSFVHLSKLFFLQFSTSSVQLLGHIQPNLSQLMHPSNVGLSHLPRKIILINKTEYVEGFLIFYLEQEVNYNWIWHIAIAPFGEVFFIAIVSFFIGWLINYLVFYTLSAIFRPYNGVILFGYLFFS